VQQGSTWKANFTAHTKNYAKYLNLWRAVYTKAITTGVDGVAGASQNSFSTQTGTWSVAGLPKGTYRVYMQFSTSDANGPSAYVDIDVNNVAFDKQVGTLNTYFTNIRITYVP